MGSDEPAPEGYLSDRGDIDLMWAVAGGDRAALGALYDRYAGLLLALGERILHGRQEAEDVLHDVLLEVWRRASDYRPERGTVRSWLVVRMRSRCLDRRKSSSFARTVPLGERPDGGDPSADPSRAPDVAALREALAALPPDQRTVLELGFYEGLSSTEIAARINIPVGTVKSRVAAGMGKLRVGLGDPSR